MRSQVSISRMLLMLVSTFFVVGYVLFPLLQLVKTAGGGSAGISLVRDRNLWTASANSFFLSVLTVILCSSVGTFFAYTFHYKKIWYKRFFSSLFLLPLAMPPIVGVMSYLYLLGDNGLLIKLIGVESSPFNGWVAILVIHLFSFYPLTYIFVGNALKTLDTSMLEASYSLGASPAKTFFRILLPQLRPALLGAALLTFMASMASFSAPFIFSSSDRFLTTEIYYAKINGDTSLSAVLSLLLAGISILVLFLFRIYSNRLPGAGKTKGTPKQNPLHAHDRNSPILFLISSVFGLLILLPIFSLLLLSLLPENVLMQEGLSYDYSLINYKQVFEQSAFFDPLVNSFQFSFLAIILTVLLGLSIASLLRGKPHLLKTLLETAATIPYGIPGTVIGICLILSFNQPTVFSFEMILVGTYWILPIAYTIRNLPILTQAVKAGLHSIDTSVEEASISLGASRSQTWRSITLPLIFPSIVEGALLVFINSFGEFVATVLLYNYSTKTVPIEIYAQMRLFNNGMAAAYGVLIFALILCVVLLTRRYLRQRAS